MRTFTPSSLLPLAVLTMLAGFTFWLEHASRDDGAGSRSKLRHDADYWAESFTVRRFGTDGSPRHLLTAQRMEHFPDDDSTEITAPRLVFERAERKTVVTARMAKLDAKGEHVRLIDDVLLVRQDDKEDGDTVIGTTLLHVIPDDERAYTSVPVTIAKGQSTIHGAGGLEVDNKTQVAVISGPVTGSIRRQAK